MESYDDVLHKGFDEYREFVNPLIAQRAQMAGEPVRFTRVVDRLLQFEDGRVFEDLHGTQAFGHRHPAITEAVRAYLASDAPNWYPSRINPFAGRLAKRLCERAGDAYSNVYFACSGSDAVEASLKLARAATRRPRLLSLERGYHGCTFGSVSLMHDGPFTEPFRPLLPGAEKLPFGDVDALARALCTDDVAALVLEPVQGEGGLRRLPAEYVAAACELTARHGTLLVADEVQTGFGRSGRFLLSAEWPRRPDAVLLAKQLGGGLAPVSAMITRRDLFEKAYGADFEDGEAHNMTMSYNALSVVASLAALDLLDEVLLARVRTAGAQLRAALSDALASAAPRLFREVRGEGFMIGLVLEQPDHPWLSMEQLGFPQWEGRPTIAPLLCARLYKRGFYCFACGHDWSVARLQPRFTIDDATLARFVRTCAEELAAIGEIAA